MLVHVISKDGNPLMPCHPAKARILLKEGKAKPVKGKTGYFTIQLLYGSSGYKQEIVVGIDTGANIVPIAAVGFDGFDKLKKGFQYSALTQSYKNYLLAELRKDFTVEVTFGAITKYHRNQLSLPKSQIADALVIASEGKPIRMPKWYILEKQVKKRYPHDYIAKTLKGQPIIKHKRQPEMFGFRLWDKVSCNHAKLGKVIGYIQGRRTSGSFAIASLDGDLLIGGISYKKLKLLQPAKENYIRERRTASSPTDFSISLQNQSGSPP